MAVLESEYKTALDPEGIGIGFSNKEVLTLKDKYEIVFPSVATGSSTLEPMLTG